MINGGGVAGVTNRAHRKAAGSRMRVIVSAARGKAAGMETAELVKDNGDGVGCEAAREREKCRARI